jgi:hypothetical protein
MAPKKAPRREVTPLMKERRRTGDVFIQASVSNETLAYIIEHLFYLSRVYELEEGGGNFNMNNISFGHRKRLSFG